MKSLLDKMSQLSQVDEAKPDFLDVDKDGDKNEPMKKATKEKGEEKVKEAKQPTGKDIKKEKDLDRARDVEDEMKKGRNPYKEKGYREDNLEEAIAVQADGAEAMALLDILKLSGQQPMTQQDMTCGCGGDPMQGAGIQMSVEADEDPTYSNTPDETISDMDAVITSGNDMHKEKNQFKHSYNQGDNPMAMEELVKIEGKLKKMFESMTKE